MNSGFLIIPFILIGCKNTKDSHQAKASNVTIETSFKFEAGNYNIFWEKYTFKTNLTLLNENTLTGRFCINNKINNCKDIGPIIITRENNLVNFSFSDIVCRIKETNLPGEFEGKGTITRDNQYEFIVNGEDCRKKYTNKKVIFSKI